MCSIGGLVKNAGVLWCWLMLSKSQCCFPPPAKDDDAKKYHKLNDDSGGHGCYGHSKGRTATETLRLSRR